MPPPNLTPGTATELSPVPYTETGLDVSPGLTVWYKRAPSANEVFGFFFRGDNAEDFTVLVKLYTGNPDGSGLVEVDGSPWTDQNPIYYLLQTPNTYFWEIETVLTSAGAETLRVNADVFTQGSYANGSIAIHDDTAGFPLAVINNLTGAPAFYTTSVFPASEGGQIIPDGTLAVVDNVDGLSVKIYDINLNLLDTIVLPFACDRMASNYLNKFMPYDFTNARVILMDPDGTLGSTINLPSYTTDSIGAGLSYDANFVYYGRRGQSLDVMKYNISLASEVVFASPPSGSHSLGDDILVLSDESVLIMWETNAGAISVIQYNSSGTILNTYTIPDPGSATVRPRMAFATDSPTSFWVWRHQTPNDGFGKLYRINVSTGVATTTIAVREFQIGQWQGNFDGDNEELFGVSISCAFWQMLNSPATPGNINKIVPGSGKSNDTLTEGTDVAIPNPYFITAPIGD